MDNIVQLQKESIVFDWGFLLEASKKLHGYLLHTWFAHYLNLIAENMHRWIESGALGPDGQPTKETDYRLLFDFDAINIEKITYILGFYLFIFSSHKKANYFLMQESRTKRVLYLRGFDYEGATRTGGGLAMGYASVDTARFSHQLAEHLLPGFEIFTCLSPKDLFWDTVGPQKYFHGDFDRLIQACSEPIRSIHLNANHWQADISELIDRMDHFVVYVSSITASVLWEIEQLKKKKRTGQTTIVFDEEAIANKKIQDGMQEKMKELFRDDVIWSKSHTETETLMPAKLREELTQSFLVVSPDDFFKQIKQLKARIKKARARTGIKSRHEPFPFRFSPALDAAELKRIYDFDATVEAVIRKQIAAKRITNLPWFLNIVQLKIYTSLMLGKHDETGRALAVYGAVMDVVGKQFSNQPSEDVMTEDQKTPAREKLLDHFEMADYASPRLMAYGNSHEFGDYSAKALGVYAEVSAAASAAVEGFYKDAYRRRLSRKRKTGPKPGKKRRMKDRG